MNGIAGFMLEDWYVFDNFAPFQITWRGKLYPTSEHAYQAAHFFETDKAIAELVRQQLSPRLASDIANAHSDREDPEWASRKCHIMYDICKTKLVQHEYVQDTLLRTGSLTIVEMNENDSFWGWGKDHNGRNELGKIWMKLREELRQERGLHAKI